MTSLAQLERGAVGYWCPMLATTGLRLYDRSGRGNHGTLTNMVPASDWVTAKVRNTSGRVLDFDGSDDLVIGSPNYSVGGQFSFFAWLNLASSTGFHWVAGKTDFGQNKRSWHFYWSATNTRWELGTSATGATASICLYSATDTIVTGSWMHIGFVYNASAAAGARVRFFKNGSEITTTAITEASIVPLVNDVPIAFSGSRSNGTYSNYFQGQSAEYAIWNRTLTVPEIRRLYQLGPGWFGRREARRRYGKAGGVTTNRRRRLICGANC